VTGGHIPWITVGLPNGGYTILRGRTGGNVKRIAPANTASWMGVRLDLDEDYQPNETFEIRFAVMQHVLLYRKGDECILDFTPGWYDRAETYALTIELAFFASLEQAKAAPKPTRVDGQSMIWERAHLAEGKRVRITVRFPGGLFAEGVRLHRPPKPGLSRVSKGVLTLIIVVGFGVIALVIAFLVRAGASGGRYGGGGSVFLGGSHYYGGGGCVASCACACAGCACACACAGGGAAGCDRKLTRTCPLCRRCERQADCPLQPRT
jgi:hypothetical protein